MTLYGRTSAMKFPNNPWPGKGKGDIHKSSPWLHSKNIPPIRHDPATTTTDASFSSSDNSFHSNSDESHDAEDTVSNGLSTKRPAAMNQLTRRPLHTYTPTGARGVSVNGTGIKATSYPSSQY